MKNSSKLLTFSALFFFSAPLFAYIDPGSGSAIMSAIIGFFVAVTMAVKTYWYKIKSILGLGNKTESLPEEEDKSSEH